MLCIDAYGDMDGTVTAVNPYLTRLSMTWVDKSLCLDSMSNDIVKDMSISLATSIGPLTTSLTTCQWNLGSTECGSHAVRPQTCDLMFVTSLCMSVLALHWTLTFTCSACCNGMIPWTQQELNKKNLDNVTEETNYILHTEMCTGTCKLRAKHYTYIYIYIFVLPRTSSSPAPSPSPSP